MVLPRKTSITINPFRVKLWNNHKTIYIYLIPGSADNSRFLIILFCCRRYRFCSLSVISTTTSHFPYEKFIHTYSQNSSRFLVCVCVGQKSESFVFSAFFVFISIEIAYAHSLSFHQIILDPKEWTGEESSGFFVFLTESLLRLSCQRWMYNISLKNNQSCFQWYFKIFDFVSFFLSLWNSGV